MKKIISMVGVGAMVLTLGVGSAFAQQSSTQSPQGSAPSVVQGTQGQGPQSQIPQGMPATGKPGDVDKNKLPLPKADTSVKPDKAVPPTAAGEKASGKASDEKTASDKANEHKAPVVSPTDKSAPMKAPADVKPNNPLDQSGAKPVDKGTDVKSTTGVKSDAAPAVHSKGTTTDKADEKKLNEKKDAKTAPLPEPNTKQ